MHHLLTIGLMAATIWALHERARRYRLMAIVHHLQQERDQLMAQHRHLRVQRDNARWLLRGAYQDCEKYRIQIRQLSRLLGRQAADAMRMPTLWEN